MYYHNKNLTANAKKLRQNMTKEERKLWYDFLRKYPVRFLRQKIINNFIVDFYCAQASLIIEIDGGQHYENDALVADNLRYEHMEQLGYFVMRFTNIDINTNFEAVCELIDKFVKERISE